MIAFAFEALWTVTISVCSTLWTAALCARVAEIFDRVPEGWKHIGGGLLVLCCVILFQMFPDEVCNENHAEKSWYFWLCNGVTLWVKGWVTRIVSSLCGLFGWETLCGGAMGLLSIVCNISRRTASTVGGGISVAFSDGPIAGIVALVVICAGFALLRDSTLRKYSYPGWERDFRMINPGISSTVDKELIGMCKKERFYTRNQLTYPGWEEDWHRINIHISSTVENELESLRKKERFYTRNRLSYPGWEQDFQRVCPYILSTVDKELEALCKKEQFYTGKGRCAMQ